MRRAIKPVLIVVFVLITGIVLKDGVQSHQRNEILRM